MFYYIIPSPSLSLLSPPILADVDSGGRFYILNFLYILISHLRKSNANNICETKSIRSSCAMVLSCPPFQDPSPDERWRRRSRRMRMRWPQQLNGFGFWLGWTIKINKLRRLPRSVHLLFGTSRESCTSCPVIVVVGVVLENGFKYN